MSKFQVGDIVEAFGRRGVVVNISCNADCPIRVDLDNSVPNGINFMYFTKDGKYFNWAKEPSLKLIERPKKKVKVDRKVYMVIGLNKDGYIEDGAYAVKYTSYVDAVAAQDRFRILWPNLIWIVQEVFYNVEIDQNNATILEGFDGNFMVGDKVRYKGIEGRVVEILKSDALYPVMVTLKGEERARLSFTRDGKFLISEPATLEFVSRGEI